MYLLSQKVNRNSSNLWKYFDFSLKNSEFFEKNGEKLPVCKENRCPGADFYKHAFKMIDIKMSCKKHTNALKKIMTN